MSYHPTIDECAARLNGDDSNPEVLAILAAGRDIASQLGRIADHITIDLVVAEAAAFGRSASGATVHQHFHGDPNIATRDEAAVALSAARSV